MKRLILNDNHELVEVDAAVYKKWIIESKNTVAFDKLGDVMVSTIFLGIGHLLFETMVFDSSDELLQWRSATWDKAMANHRAAVARYSK